MSTLGKLTVTLELESAKFQSALGKSDYDAQKFARNFVVNMEQARQKAKHFSDNTTQYLKNIETTANNLNKTIRFEAFANHINRAKTAVHQFSQMSDKYTELSNKLKLVSADETQHARAMAAVYDISLKTAQSTEATSSVYQTFAQNAKQLGISQSDVAKLTETVAKSVAISGQAQRQHPMP